jgi:transcription termination factor Rho
MVTGGVLKIVPDGWGFLHFLADETSSSVIYLSPNQIVQHDLKTGDLVTGQVRPPKETEKYHSLSDFETINGKPA